MLVTTSTSGGSSFVEEKIPFYLFQNNEKFEGICANSLTALQRKIAKFSNLASVQFWDARQLPPAQWGKKAVFVLPGGDCRLWDKHFSRKSCEEVFAWFKNGGRLYAVCAGGYYCSARSEYQLNSNEKIEDINVLALFQGVCRGPAYSAELKIIKIKWEKTQEEGYACVYGGGIFIPDSCSEGPEGESGAMQKDQVLATFVEAPHKGAIAVVKSFKNAGIGILSAVHWEYSEKHLQAYMQCCEVKRIDEVNQKLELFQGSKEFRQRCLADILSQLTKE